MRTLLMRFQAEDDELRRRRAAQIAAEIEAEKEIQERADRLARDRDYWLREREKDGPLMTKLVEQYQEIVDDSPFRRKMLAKLAELAELEKEINRVAARSERKALMARGVVRGRRK
jgi:succinate dehydrogenase/fumarate reductase flavoprotein subunit